MACPPAYDHLARNSAILHLGYPVSELYAQAYANPALELALLGLVVSICVCNCMVGKRDDVPASAE